MRIAVSSLAFNFVSTKDVSTEDNDDCVDVALLVLGTPMGRLAVL